jgi:hypothetical protein
MGPSDELTQELPPAWLDAAEVDDGSTDLPELEPEPAVAGGSVLAALKAQRAELGADRHFDYEVPGWHGLLVLRFGAISPAQQNDLSNRIIATKGKQVPNANLDTLIAAFRCALGRAEPGGELEVIPAADGEPAGLKALVELIGLPPATSARAAMRLLFAGANSPETALTSLGADWHEWGTNTNEEVDEQFTGES